MSTSGEIPSNKIITEETRSQVTSGSTEEINTLSVTNPDRKRRARKAKTTARALLPYSFGTSSRCSYSNSDTGTASRTRVYPMPMFARKSNTSRPRGRRRPRGGAQRRYRPEETENPACENKDTSSTGQIDSKNSHEDIEACREYSREVEPMEIDDHPQSNPVEIDSVLKPMEELKPKSTLKCSIQLSRVEIEPEPIAMDDIDTASSSNDGYVQFDERFDPGSESDDCLEKEARDVDNKLELEAEVPSCVNKAESNMMPKIVGTEKHRKRVRGILKKPKETRKNGDKFEASWLETNSTSEIVKPENKRGRPVKNKRQKIRIVHESAKTDENLGVGTEEASISTEPIPVEETKPKTKRKRTSTSTSPRKRMKSEIIESKKLPTDLETKDTVVENIASIGIQTRKVKRVRQSKTPIIVTRGKAQAESNPKTESTQSKAVDDERDRKIHALLKHILPYPITNKNKHLLLDPKHQPYLVLWNIANGDKLSKKQKEFLRAQKLRNQTVRFEDGMIQKPRKADQTVPKVVREEPKKIHVQNLRKKLQLLFNIKTAENSQGRRKKTTKEPQQRKKKTTIQRNKAEKKIWRKMELPIRVESVQCPDTIVTNASESSVLSVFENGSNEGSTSQEVRNIVIVVPNPLVSGMNDSSVAIGQPNQVTEPIPQNDGANEQTNRLGSSTFNITDLSNSFVELIDDQTGSIANPGADNIVLKNPNLEDNEYREENITLHRSDDNVYPTTVSLLALDHVNKLPTTSVQKSNEIEEFGELQQEKISFESYETQDEQHSIDPIIYDVNLNDASDRQVEGLDTDISSLKVQRRSVTERSTKKKSMPIIIADETFPRGSMELGSINCRSPGLSSSDNNNDGTEGNEEIRELKIHNQSTYTSVVNLEQSDKNNINFGCDAVDNSRQFENLDEEPAFLQQDDQIGMKSSEQYNRSPENRDPIDDPFKLWRLCSGLGEEYVDNTNNNNDKPCNLDKIHANDVNSDDFDANILDNNMSRDVVATKSCPYETRSESSASVVSHHPSTSPKTPVVAVLTTTNLKKFTVMTNRHRKGGGSDWSEEQCRKYLRKNDSEKSMPNAGTEIGCEGTEYISKSETEFSQAGSKKLKRKWIKKEEDTSLKGEAKRVKLNRKTWSNDRKKDSENVDNFLVRTPLDGSICSDNAGVSNTAEENKSNYIETIEEEKTIQNVDDHNPEELEETLQISPKKKNDDNATNSSTICFDTNINLLTETQNCDPEGEKLVEDLVLLQGKLRSSRSSQDTQNENDCKNSSQSSSSTSSSNSSTSSSSGSGSSSSTTSKKSSPNPEKLPEAEPPELDDDVLSIGGNSMFTMYNDHVTDLADPWGMTPLYEPQKEFSAEAYHMANVGAYFDKNMQECDEAYESCKQEEKTVCIISNEQSGTVRNQNQIAGTSAPATQGSNLYHNPNLSQRLGPLTSYPNMVSTNFAKNLFHGHCFTMMIHGMCNKIKPKCRFSHILSLNLTNLPLASAQQIMETICTAINRGYNNFVMNMYPSIMRQTDYLSMVRLFHKLIDSGLMTNQLVQTTFLILNERKILLIEFVRDASTMVNVNQETLDSNLLWTLISNAVPLGMYWNTFRDLLINMTNPLSLNTNIVIAECIHTNKDKSHINDVYTNYVMRLTPEQLANVPIELRRQLDGLLRKHNLVYQPDSKSSENVTETAKHCEAPIILSPNTILSPDDPYCSPRQILEPNFPAAHSVRQEKTEDLITPASPTDREIEPTPEPNVRILESNEAATDSTSNNYVLKPIDSEPPCSVFRDVHCTFHTSMTSVVDALRKGEYTWVLKVLNEYSYQNKTLFTSSCYQLLRKNVMTSAQHVKRLIELSVRMGVNKTTHQIISNLGVYLMVELCNTNTWIRAYELFKSLNYYDLTKKVASFALIGAQICLANRRPLKAFNILKHNNMFCARRNKWKVDESIPKDEEFRVEVISLLLRVLCDGHVEYAYHIFTCILNEQMRIYHPIDLTKCVDNLVLGILKGNSIELIPEIGRLIMDRNFMLQDTTFKSLVVGVFKHDVLLSKRLYRYSTYVGVYSKIELRLPLHVLIKTDFEREEMYLVIEDFINKLSMDLGPAIGRLGPNHFSIFLIFELTPFKQNPDGMYNEDVLKASKKLMKTVLMEDFNPPLKTIKAEQERSLKLQSRSVVDYLKSMHA